MEYNAIEQPKKWLFDLSSEGIMFLCNIVNYSPNNMASHIVLDVDKVTKN
jgi:hypothetical protein